MAGKKQASSARVKLLVGIISKKDVNAFTEAVNSECVAVNFGGIASGTARSNYLTYLGLDEIEKRIMFSIIPDYCEKQVLKAVNKGLKLYLIGKGIAFTMPVSGISSIISTAVLSTPEDQTKTQEAKKMTSKEKTETAENAMNDKNQAHDLIFAVVNRKFTDQVLESTRLAGATGATLLHTRSIGNDKAEQVMGTTLKEDTDTIALLAASDFKLKIMEAIRDTAGLKTDGGAVIFSLPVDSIAGIGRFSHDEDADE